MLVGDSIDALALLAGTVFSAAVSLPILRYCKKDLQIPLLCSAVLCTIFSGKIFIMLSGLDRQFCADLLMPFFTCAMALSDHGKEWMIYAAWHLSSFFYCALLFVTLNKRYDKLLLVTYIAVIAWIFLDYSSLISLIQPSGFR